MINMIEKIKKNRITKLMLEQRGIISDKQINNFLYPSLDNLKNPFNYIGVKECVERIEHAIKLNERVLICGDYDTDGISASVILYQYLKSRGLICEVHIPSRIDDGYGISLDFITKMEIKPNLIITVDCGISCAEEIEHLQSLGIDVLVTDHHNIPEKTPNCVIFDPKQEKELFNGYCGAGVVLKLIQALGGDEEFKKYIDIAAIATIGDIVPLVDENRTIVKFGLEKINKNPNKNLKLVLDFLNLSNLTSTDISFKLVPFLNSAGRVGFAKKVFDMFCEENQTRALELISSINQDNEKRLKSKEEGLKIIDTLLSEIDLNESKCLFLASEGFDEGIIGILASMLSGKFKRPAIVFSKKGEILKGSGRSYGNFNLHGVVMKYAHLCEKVGGHDYACGLSISSGNFNAFIEGVNKELENTSFEELPKFDFEIEPDEITSELFSLVSMFEPFGLDNAKPKFMLLAQNMSYDYLSIKSHKHYLLNVEGVKIVAFFAKKYLPIFDSQEMKQLIVELNINKFAGKTSNQILLKDVITKDVFKMRNNDDEVLKNEIWCTYLNLNNNTYDAVEIEEEGLAELIYTAEDFGVIFVASCQTDFEKFKEISKACEKKFAVRFLPFEDTKSMLCTTFEVNPELFFGYKKIVYLKKPGLDINFKAEPGQEIFVVVDDEKLETLPLSLERKDFAVIFNYFNKFIAENKTFDDEQDIIESIFKVQKGYSKSQIVLCFCVFLENNFIVIESVENGKIKINKGKTTKSELSNSKIYNMVSEKLWQRKKLSNNLKNK